MVVEAAAPPRRCGGSVDERGIEPQFRLLAEAIPQVVWAARADGACDYVNRRWCEYTGLSVEQAVGHGYRASIHPDDVGRYSAAWQAAVERAATFELEYRLRRSDGVYRWFLGRAEPMQGDGGRAARWLGTATDIDDRKRAREAARRGIAGERSAGADLLDPRGDAAFAWGEPGEARFRNMADHAPVMIWTTDVDMSCTYLNRPWCDFTGQTEEAGLGFGWLEAVHPDDLEPAREAFRRAHERREAFRLDYRLRRKDGVYRWCIDSASPRLGPGGQFLGYIGSVIDITERKEWEILLQDSEARFRQLADAMPQIVWASHPDGRPDYYNRRWYELTGAAEGEIGDESWIPYLHPDDRQRSLDVWYRSVATGEPYEIEYRLQFPAGRGFRWHLARGLPVRGPAGDIVRWYGTCTDIQDRKRLEETLKEADRRKDEFLAMLAHELRNPLGPIRNAVEILRLVGPQPPRIERACEMIDRQIAHMSRLVDDLLDVSRIARGRIQLRKERCDLTRVVSQTAEDYRSTLESRGITLDVTLPLEALWVSGDPTRLSQIVSNVLHNASKFTDPGGRVAVALSPGSDGGAVIRMRDTGIGMDAAMLSRLFEPCSQADRSLERSRGGLGLGLALVKGLVELHGGAVSASSPGLGQGTEVVISLPLERRGAPSLERAAPSSHQARSLRVLIIEDNEDAAESLQMLLALSGNRVEVAPSGPAGVEAARSFAPEVVLCDIGLPGGMDGYAVARALRGNLGLSSALLVALTGYGQDEDQRRAREAGFDMHMVKPIEPGRLRKVLSSFAARA